MIDEIPTDIVIPLDSNSVLTAEVTGAHGVSGNVRVRLIASNLTVAVRALEAADTVTARSADGKTQRTLTLRSIRPLLNAKGAHTVKFREIPDRNGAEALYGFALYVPSTALPELDPGEYYIDDLIGIKAVTDSGHDLGLLTEVLTTPANDVYVTDQNVMIPAVDAFLVSMDIPGRLITVRDIPGLRDDQVTDQ